MTKCSFENLSCFLFYFPRIALVQAFFKDGIKKPTDSFAHFQMKTYERNIFQHKYQLKT